MKIGRLDKVVFFGGGALLVDFALEARKRDIIPIVFAAERHLDEIIDFEKKVVMKDRLASEGIEFYSVSDINKTADLAKVVDSRTMGIGLGETYTFDTSTIELFGEKLFDFMVIRLPQYRGGAHFTWQILKDSNVGAWNIQVINEEMVPGVFDSGKILRTREYNIPEWVRKPADFFKVSDEEGLNLFREFLDDIQNDLDMKLSELNEDDSSYFPRLYTMKHGYIDWTWSSNEIEKFVRAFDDPYVGASTFIDGKRMYLKNCQIIDQDGEFHPFMAGLVYRINDNGVHVATRDKAILIGSVKDDSGKDVASSIKLGQRFFTPLKILEEAMMFNAEYDASGIKK